MRVLVSSTFAFTICFAVWMIFAVLGIRIKDELGLSESQFGLMVALPILTGSLVRLPLGLITDRFGGRIVFFIHMLLVAIPIYGLAFATQYWHYLVLGLFVGLAGGSFAVGIAYTSAWFEKERQGTAMGIFGAGNAGAAITNLVAPMIVVAFGWRMVPQVYSVAMLVTAVLFWLFTWTDPAHLKGAAEASQRPTLAKQLAPLAELRVWRFGLYYFFVFGGFVALALWLPKYYIAEYGLDLKTASFITMLFTLPSGLIRALGGWFSDHYGARSVNWGVFWVCLVCLFFLSYPQTHFTVLTTGGPRQFDIGLGIGLNVWLFTFLVFVVGIAQGFGKASVYRIIHDYYPSNMGTVGGMVGVIGGLGGFCLPILFGYAADHIGVRSSCFMLLFGLTVVCMVWMHYAIKQQRRIDGPKAPPPRGAKPPRPFPPTPEECRHGHDRQYPTESRTGTAAARLAPRGPRVLGAHRQAHRQPQPVDLDPRAAARLRRVDDLEHGDCAPGPPPASPSATTSCSCSPRCRRSPAPPCACSIRSWCRSSAVVAGPP